MTVFQNSYPTKKFSFFRKCKKFCRTTVRVFGSILVSFPATVVPVLTDLTSDIDPLIVTLKNADKIKTISPNSQVVPFRDIVLRAIKWIQIIFSYLIISVLILVKDCFEVVHLID